ncbi:uncharacterized protein ATC70_011043 [Mucor velutinosus]|uniref:Reverse transcriptase domain-containing protein n=1 Tax=Mucor velutinosus TaxID=708070 RepID=A0AAN7I0R3_9FUNG|nr:hypothetical protein ATC70_011043 [Mucor velutinosus]
MINNLTSSAFKKPMLPTPTPKLASTYNSKQHLLYGHRTAGYPDRYIFYDQLLQRSFFQTLITNMNTAEGLHNNHLSNVTNAPSIVVGDFNYNFRRYRPPSIVKPASIQLQWLFHSMLTHYYQENTHELIHEPQVPTFRRNTTFTTIDYMFLNPQLMDFRTDQFVHLDWTDHAMLSTQLTFDNPDLGKGLWRANPQLVHNEYFCQRLFTKLDDFHTLLASNANDLTPQVIWDQIKELTRQVAKSCSRRQSEWRRRLLRRLQSKRNKLLRLYKTTQGEKSAGFLKRLTSQRSQQQAIPTLQHPISSSDCATTKDKRAAAVAYYERLYTADIVDTEAIRYFTDQIPHTDKILDSDHPFGIDSLPYAIIQLLFTHPLTAAIALRVYFDALSDGVLPQSWQETCLVLLPKKGDPALLQNWRPISLICCDAKIFTRLLNARLMLHFGTRLTTSQPGFMPHHFIGEPAMTLHCALSLATATHSTSIALLLDQEKAYDRVNLEYLTAVLTAFNMPPSLISSLLSLFTNTQVRVNINGVEYIHYDLHSDSSSSYQI